MRNPICISTGCVYRFSDDRNDLIEALRQFSPEGIEISFAYPEYLLNFNINKKNLKYLQGLKFNSIHSPCNNMTYGKNKMSKEILQKISELYKQVNARNIVFHKGQVEDYDSILSNDFVSSIENDDWRKSEHDIEDIKKVLDKNGKFKFTFDFAHAITISASDIPEYINYFKNKLIEIHISIVNKDSKEHEFLYQHGSREIKESLQYLKITSASVPLVLEGAVFSSEELEFVKKEIEEEIEYIKKI